MSLVDFVSTPRFEEYKDRFKQHYKLERREAVSFSFKRIQLAGRSS